MRVQVTRVYHAYVWSEWLSDASQSADQARPPNFSTKKYNGVRDENQSDLD